MQYSRKIKGKEWHPIFHNEDGTLDADK